MQGSYIYSGTYANVLSSRLLTDAQRELLLATESIGEVRKVLLDTPFSPHLTEGVDVKSALMHFAVEQKELLQRLAPEPEALAPLLLRYDYYNLRQVISGRKVGSTDEEIIANCVNLGTIEPARLLQLVTANTLRFDYPELASVVTKSENLKDVESISDIIDSTYLSQCNSIAQVGQDGFLKRYVTLEIDLHNLLMRLRVLSHQESDSLHIQGTFVSGGSFTESQLMTSESVLKKLEGIGGGFPWREATERFLSEKDFTLLEKTVDSFRTQFLKRESIEIHSLVSLYAYFLSVLEHVQFVEAVVTAHSAGLDMDTLRSLVRNSFHSYAY